MRYRANYALLEFGEHLGPHEQGLDVPWATFVGDRSSEQRFHVPVGDPVDSYLELQAYEVDSFGHDIRLNGEPLSGFDIPPANGWQYWMDAITGAELVKGENTVQVIRDPEAQDSFVVGNVTVHWREPLS